MRRRLSFGVPDTYPVRSCSPRCSRPLPWHPVFDCGFRSGATSSNLSVSYSVDFAALLLIGTEMTMLVAGVSAWLQSAFGHDHKRNPVFRIVFNAAALVLTVQAAGLAFAYLGWAAGRPRPESSRNCKAAGRQRAGLLPGQHVDRRHGRRAGQPASRCGRSGRRTSCGPRPATSSAPAPRWPARSCGRRRQWWLLPLAAAPVYLTFRSYRMYVDRLASEKRHKEEVLRLHGDTVAALEAARQVGAALRAGGRRLERRPVGLGHPGRRALLLGRAGS